MMVHHGNKSTKTINYGPLDLLDSHEPCTYYVYNKVFGSAP